MFLIVCVCSLGIALTVTTTRRGDFKATLTTQLYTAWVFLGVSLLGSLIVVAANGWRAPKWWAGVLYLLYGAFMVTSVVQEAA